MEAIRPGVARGGLEGENPRVSCQYGRAETSMRYPIQSLALTSILVMTACGAESELVEPKLQMPAEAEGQEELQEPSVLLSVRLTPEGGQIQVPADGASPLAGFVIDIPAGAVDAEVEIEIAQARAIISDERMIGLGPAVALTPAQLRFNRPARIRLPTMGSAKPENIRVLGVSEDGGPRWVESHALHVEENAVSFEVDGLASFQAGQRRVGLYGLNALCRGRGAASYQECLSSGGSAEGCQAQSNAVYAGCTEFGTRCASHDDCFCGEFCDTTWLCEPAPILPCEDDSDCMYGMLCNPMSFVCDICGG